MRQNRKKEKKQHHRLSAHSIHTPSAPSDPSPISPCSSRTLSSARPFCHRGHRHKQAQAQKQTHTSSLGNFVQPLARTRARSRRLKTEMPGEHASDAVMALTTAEQATSRKRPAHAPDSFNRPPASPALQPRLFSTTEAEAVISKPLSIQLALSRSGHRLFVPPPIPCSSSVRLFNAYAIAKRLKAAVHGITFHSSRWRRR